MRVAIYMRVSTKKQTTELQEKDLREYCRAKGYADTQDYIDLGISGSKRSRPQLDSLMSDARKGKIGMVLVWRFDRFGRNTAHILQSLEEFRSLGVRFVSYSESIDTGTPMGQVVFTIMGALAQFERELTRERVIAGIETAKAKGKKLGRKREVKDDDVKRLRDEGYSQRSIASRLGICRRSVQNSLERIALLHARGSSKPSQPVGCMDTKPV